MRRLLVVLGVLVVLVLTGGPALADPPFRLDRDVVDEVGALDGEQPRVRAALDALDREAGVQLFVVFVSSFDGASGNAWAESTAGISQLGPADALLAVAVDDRAYGFLAPATTELDPLELQDLAARSVEPEFRDGDWVGGVVAFADLLRTGRTSARSPERTGDGGSGIGTVAVVGGLAAVGAGAYLVSRARRRRQGTAVPPTRRLERPDPHAGVPTEQLQARASTALLELDEAVRTSRLDLDFARLQYGEEAVAGFAEALATSEQELTRAFTLRQELDDDIPEDEPTRRRMLAEMLRLTDAADARLDEQAEAFDRLRDLERNAPQALEALSPRIAALAERIPREEERLGGLLQRYPASALGPVAENVDQARARLAAAEQEVAEARAALAEGRPGAAVADIRAAEDAVAQTGTLLDAVARFATDLDAAAARIPVARAGTEQDLAEARALLAAGDRSGLRPQVARAEAGLSAADAALHAADGGLPDPFAVLRHLEEADLALQQALGVARDAQTRTRRAAAALEQALLAARSGIAATADFVDTRRGAVGAQARTRLAEAQRHLDAAHGLAADDPVAALREAQAADQLAQQALRLAQEDVSAWSSGYGGGYGPAGFPGGYGGRGHGGYGYGGRGGVDLGSLVLGGILFGGGGRGGGGGGFGGSAGRPRSGSFGGSRSRGRSGGGRF